MRIFGLVGYPLQHSFSPACFQRKFAREKITDADYQLFPIEKITDFPRLIASRHDWAGLNVTLPYKTAILPYLDEIDETAAAIGAVNVIKFVSDSRNIKRIGYNSDAAGFERSLKAFLPTLPANALILGTGGAARAVDFVLRKNHVKTRFVSRKKQDNCLTYNDLSEELIRTNPLIINATPVGMFPNINEKPPIPYAFLTIRNALFDLNYNPEETAFLHEGKIHGVKTHNGLQMLEYQAEESWCIWTS